jgi:hypothetical protein
MAGTPSPAPTRVDNQGMAIVSSIVWEGTRCVRLGLPASWVTGGVDVGAGAVSVPGHQASEVDIDDLSKGIHLVLSGDLEKVILSGFDTNSSGLIDLRCANGSPRLMRVTG